MNPFARSADSELLRRSKSHLLVDDIAAPEIRQDDQRHLTSVLRIGLGDPLTITDGRGNWQPGVWDGGGFEPVADHRFLPRSGMPVTVGVAIPKQDRPEWIVQKCAEIGVARLVFIESERSVVRWEPVRAAKKVDKLGRTAREALRQSRGVWLMDIDGPTDAAEMLSTSAIAEPGAGPLDAISSDVTTFLIGPEGGWSAAECEAAQASFGLGDTILRVETAALVVACRTISSF